MQAPAARHTQPQGGSVCQLQHRSRRGVAAARRLPTPAGWLAPSEHLPPPSCPQNFCSHASSGSSSDELSSSSPAGLICGRACRVRAAGGMRGEGEGEGAARARRRQAALFPALPLLTHPPTFQPSATSTRRTAVSVAPLDTPASASSAPACGRAASERASVSVCEARGGGRRHCSLPTALPVQRRRQQGQRPAPQCTLLMCMYSPASPRGPAP